MIVGIGEIEIAQAVDDDSLDVGELGRQCRSTVAHEGAARHRFDMIGHTCGIGSPHLGGADGNRQDARVALHPLVFAP